MAIPSNFLQNVQTYQRAELAWMVNTFALVGSATNKKFDKFENLTANLGNTVTFDLAPRYLTYDSLVATFQSSNQRVQSLVASQSANVASSFSDQQFIFNAEDYMTRFGMSAVMELGSKIERDIGLNIVSGVRNQLTGSLQTDSGPFRFYSAGIVTSGSNSVCSPINSFGQLAQAIANFKDFGAAPIKLQGIIPSVYEPGIVNSGQNQFTLDRNNTNAITWRLGTFSECDWMRSNLLPLHIAGSVGQAVAPNNVLTLVSTNDPTGENITQLTFSGAIANDPNAIKSGDMFQFNDGVSGFTNLRFLTFIGHAPSSQPVQFRATNDAAANGSGNVVVNINPALVYAATANQNLNTALLAGMKVTVQPSHRAGLIHSGNQFYLAMPKLPDQSPYQTVTQQDEKSGVSIRHYWGADGLGQNIMAYIRDIIWGSTLVPENSMRVLFPQ